MLRSDLCNFNDAYIVVKKDIILTKGTDKDFTDTRKGSLAFKNSTPFIYCISKINNVLIVYAEDLDVIMSMYNLLEYIKNYKKKQQEVCGIITGMNLIILLLIPLLVIILLLIIMQTPKQILHHLNRKQKLQEKHQMQIKRTVKTLTK